MARATIELYTASDGWIEVPVFNPSNVGFAPLEVETPNGWGAFHLIDPSEADTPIELYTSSRGWQGINTTGYYVFDDFERGNLNPYAVNGDANNMIVSNSDLRGQYVLRLSVQDSFEASDTDDKAAYSSPNFSTTLPDYPKPGDTFSIFWRSPYLEVSSWPPFHFVFGDQSAISESGSPTISDLDEYYELYVENESDAYLDAVSYDTRETISDAVITLSSTEDYWFEFRIKWPHSGDFTGGIYSHGGSYSENPTHLDNFFGLGDVSDYGFDKGGIGFFRDNTAEWQDFDLLIRRNPL